MKRSLLEYICCAACKGDLIPDTDDDEIDYGFLICKRCGKKYIIKEGIPNILPDGYVNEF